MSCNALVGVIGPNSFKGSKGARTNDIAQAEVDDAMAVIQLRLDTNARTASEIEGLKARVKQLSSESSVAALEIEGLKARVKQLGSESSAAASRYQQLSDEQTILELDHKIRVETQNFDLWTIRKELEALGIKTVEMLAEKNRWIALSEEYRKTIRFLSEEKAMSERIIQELRTQEQENGAKLKEFEKLRAQLKKFVTGT